MTIEEAVSGRMSGKQIKLFLIDGTAGGLTTAEITNWTGHDLSAGRRFDVTLQMLRTWDPVSDESDAR